MRIKLNDKTAQAVADIMLATGWLSPTHTINVIVGDYLNNLNHNPVTEVSNNGDRKGEALQKV